MVYSQCFHTGVARDGARYVARWDGEWCGTYNCEKAAQAAISLKEKAEKAALALDKAARPYFCDGRHGVWRAVERGDSLARDVESAFNNHHKAAMALNAHMGRA